MGSEMRQRNRLETRQARCLPMLSLPILRLIVSHHLYYRHLLKYRPIMLIKFLPTIKP